MSGDLLASLGYLALLLLALGGAYLASHRQSVGKSLQMALVWGMIFMGCMAIYGLWGDISRDYGSAWALYPTPTAQYALWMGRQEREGHAAT